MTEILKPQTGIVRARRFADRDKRLVIMTFALATKEQGPELARLLQAQAIHELGCTELYTHGDVVSHGQIEKEHHSVAQFEEGQTARGRHMLRMRFAELRGNDHAKAVIDRMVRTAENFGILPNHVKWELKQKPAHAFVSVPIVRLRGRPKPLNI